VPPHEQDRHGQHRAECERDTPADVFGKPAWLEQHDAQAGAGRGAEPEAAVDREIDEAAHARGDQLVDRRVDSRVLSADAEARQKPTERERPEVPRPRREQRCNEIDGQRREE
jgi:hypothetical protein